MTDQVAFPDRFAGGSQPLLPLARAGRLPISVQQIIPAEWAAALLHPKQAQYAATQRGLAFATPIGPVLRKSRVIRGRRSGHHVMPDDFCPGELGQVTTTVAVPEHPSIPPGGVEPAIVPVDDP